MFNYNIKALVFNAEYDKIFFNLNDFDNKNIFNLKFKSTVQT